jgi:aspartate 1-decarboxylase
MQRVMLKSKIHGATITEAVLHYEGSLTLDPILMEAADLLVNEWVLVSNMNTGSRLETYIIEGERGSGTVTLNGAAARLGAPGDQIIVMCYAVIPDDEAKTHRPTKVKVDEKNRVIGTAE